MNRAAFQITATATIREALAKLEANRLGAIMVADGHGTVIGVASDAEGGDRAHGEAARKRLSRQTGATK